MLKVTSDHGTHTVALALALASTYGSGWESDLCEAAERSSPSRLGGGDGVLCLQPFSNGLVTVMVPQLRRENSLLLWSTLDLNNPVHAFVGHDDVVLEFQWRPQKEGEPPPVSPVQKVHVVVPLRGHG